MKKVILFNYINLVIVILFATTLVFQGVYKIIPINFSRFYFPCFLFFVATSLLFKFIIFKNPAILWFSCNLFLICGALFLVYFSPLSFKEFWPIYLIIPAICSLIVGIAFKNFLHFCIFFFLFSIAFPIFLLTYDILSVANFILVFIISLLLGIFMINIIIRKQQKSRNKCNG